MPLPNTSPDMSPTPTYGEGGGLRVDTFLAEEALHALPGAARRDAHALVVVARAAAGSEGIAQPVAVLLADRVGVVGEGRGALVGGDHEVRIVAVEPHHLRRRHDGGAGEVVGQVEQGAQVVLVAGNAFLHEGVAVGRRRRLLQHEAALGADRHDDGVLHHLRLHQAEHLGAKVLRPVRPAQPAARDLAAAQVDALEARRVDEDLVQRLRLRQPGNLGRIELEAEEAATRSGRARVADAGAPEVGTQRRLDECQQLAQHAVFGQVGDLLERLLDRVDLCRRALLVARGRIETQLEQQDQHARDARVRGQRRLDRALRQGEACLLEVLRVGTQHHDLVGAQARAQHQPVEVVVLDIAAEHARKSVLEQAPYDFRLDLAGALHLQLEVVQRHRGLGRFDAGMLLAEDAHAHVLEHRQRIGQHHLAAEPVELEAERLGGGAERPVQRERERCVLRQRLDLADVGHRATRGHALAVLWREGTAPALEQLDPPSLAFGVDQRVAQLVGPAARRFGKAGLELLAVESGHLAGCRAHREMDAREHGVAQQHVEVGARSGERREQDALQPHPQVGRVSLARNEHEARDEAVERVAADEQAQPLPIAQRQDAERRFVELVIGDLEQLVARIGLEDVVERLGQMTAGGQAGPLDDRFDLAAQQRRLGHARAVRGRCEQPEEAVLADDFATLVVALDADVVGVTGAVHGRAGVGLGHHQHRQGRSRKRACIRRQRGEAGRRLLGRGLAQDAEAAAGDEAQPVVAVVGDQVVLPIAEQGQMPVGQPLQEGVAFGHVRRRQGRGRGIELGDRRAQAGDHRLPVFDGRAHVAEHALDAVHQVGALLRVDQSIDLDVHPRFARGIGASRRRWIAASRPPASRSTAKMGCTIRCSVNPRRLISVVVESTRNGMSSLTISITECREAQPSSAIEGLRTRTFALPGTRTEPNCQCDSSAPDRSSGARAARSSSSSRRKYSRAKPSNIGRRSAGTWGAAIARTASSRSRRNASVGALIDSLLSLSGRDEVAAPRGLF
jgi:hypothetical protein